MIVRKTMCAFAGIATKTSGKCDMIWRLLRKPQIIVSVSCMKKLTTALPTSKEFVACLIQSSESRSDSVDWLSGRVLGTLMLDELSSRIEENVSLETNQFDCLMVAFITSLEVPAEMYS